jgi:hypothetical protein
MCRAALSSLGEAKCRGWSRWAAASLDTGPSRFPEGADNDPAGGLRGAARQPEVKPPCPWPARLLRQLPAWAWCSWPRSSTARTLKEGIAVGQCWPWIHAQPLREGAGRLAGRASRSRSGSAPASPAKRRSRRMIVRARHLRTEIPTGRPRRSAVHVRAEVAVRHRRLVIGIGGRGQLRPAAGTAGRSLPKPVSVLPGGARDIGGHNVGGMPVQAAAGPVIPDRGSRVGM